MTLFRAGARTLLASQFIVSGFKAVRDPQPLVPAAQPMADKLRPLLQQYAPDPIKNAIPEDTTTLVRVVGALELVGGLALASGKGRRLGSALLALSLVPATLAEHPFWTRDTPEAKAADRALFLKNVSLLGGVLLAARDTEGKPGLAWRAQAGGQAIAKDTRKATKQLTSGTKGITDSALAEGAALVGAVVATSRRTQKKAAKQVKSARKSAEKQAEAARKAVKQGRKDAKKRAQAVKKDVKSDRAAAKQQAAQEKGARKQASRDRQGALAKNIKLGQN